MRWGAQSSQVRPLCYSEISLHFQIIMVICLETRKYFRDNQGHTPMTGKHIGLQIKPNSQQGPFGLGTWHLGALTALFPSVDTQDWASRRGDGGSSVPQTERIYDASLWVTGPGGKMEGDTCHCLRRLLPSEPTPGGRLNHPVSCHQLLSVCHLRGATAAVEE